MKIKKGSSRMVIITNKYAYKLPYLFRYKNFLYGLLANMQEVSFSKTKDERLAPVILSLPLGLLVVMKKANQLTNFDSDYLYNFCNMEHKMIIPAEIKKDSFGYIDDKLVAIDYG